MYNVFSNNYQLKVRGLETGNGPDKVFLYEFVVVLYLFPVFFKEFLEVTYVLCIIPYLSYEISLWIKVDTITTFSHKNLKYACLDFANGTVQMFNTVTTVK